MSSSPPKGLEQRDKDGDRMFSPSAARNKAVIAEAFERLGITGGDVLEIGSGSGEHAVEILRRYSELNWTCSDMDDDARKSCKAWAEYSELSERMSVIELDLSRPGWQDGLSQFDVIYCANVIHISPSVVFQELLLTGPELLIEGGRLVLYGPFRRNGNFPAPSNQDFDALLKSRNPEWGVRDLEQDIIPLAESAGMKLESIEVMPANNNLVVFRR